MGADRTLTLKIDGDPSLINQKISSLDGQKISLNIDTKNIVTQLDNLKKQAQSIGDAMTNIFKGKMKGNLPMQDAVNQIHQNLQSVMTEIGNAENKLSAIRVTPGGEGFDQLRANIDNIKLSIESLSNINLSALMPPDAAASQIEKVRNEISALNTESAKLMSSKNKRGVVDLENYLTKYSDQYANMKKYDQHKFEVPKAFVTAAQDYVKAGGMLSQINNKDFGNLGEFFRTINNGFARTTAGEKINVIDNNEISGAVAQLRQLRAEEEALSQASGKLNLLTNIEQMRVGISQISSLLHQELGREEPIKIPIEADYAKFNEQLKNAVSNESVKVKAELDGTTLKEQLNAIVQREKNFNISLGTTTPITNPIAKNAQYGSAARNAIREMEKQAAALEDGIPNPVSILMKSGLVPRQNVLDIVSNSRGSDSDPLNARMDNLRQYINLLQQAATMQNIDISGITSQFSRSADEIVADVNNILTGEKTAKESAKRIEKIVNMVKGKQGGSVVSGEEKKADITTPMKSGEPVTVPVKPETSTFISDIQAAVAGQTIQINTTPVINGQPVTSSSNTSTSGSNSSNSNRGASNNTNSKPNKPSGNVGVDSYDVNRYKSVFTSRIKDVASNIDQETVYSKIAKEYSGLLAKQKSNTLDDDGRKLKEVIEKGQAQAYDAITQQVNNDFAKANNSKYTSNSAYNAHLTSLGYWQDEINKGIDWSDNKSIDNFKQAFQVFNQITSALSQMRKDIDMSAKQAAKEPKTNKGELSTYASARTASLYGKRTTQDEDEALSRYRRIHQTPQSARTSDDNSYYRSATESHAKVMRDVVAKENAAFDKIKANLADNEHITGYTAKFKELENEMNNLKSMKVDFNIDSSVKSAEALLAKIREIRADLGNITSEFNASQNADIRGYQSALAAKIQGKELSPVQTEAFNRVSANYGNYQTMQPTRGGDAYIKSVQSAQDKAITSIVTKYNNAYSKLSSFGEGERINGYEGKISTLKQQIDDFAAKVKELNNMGIDLHTDQAQAELIKLNNEINETIANAKSTDHIPIGQGEISGLQQYFETIKANNSKAVKAFSKDFNAVQGSINLLQAGKSSITEKNNVSNQIKDLVAKFQAAGKAGASFGDIWKQRLTSLGAYLSTFASFYQVIRVVKETFNAVRELDTAMVELEKVSNASGQRLQQSFETSKQTAQDLGATITEVINATADWSRLGYTQDQAEELAKVAVIYEHVGDGIDIDTANKSLISTLQGFKMEASDAMEIVDKFNEVANNEPIDSSGIGEALQRSAASFQAANTDLSESIALITSANAVVQDPIRVGKHRIIAYVKSSYIG